MPLEEQNRRAPCVAGLTAMSLRKSEFTLQAEAAVLSYVSRLKVGRGSHTCCAHFELAVET